MSVKTIVELDETQNAWVERKVREGSYESAAEVLRSGVDALRSEERGFGPYGLADIDPELLKTFLQKRAEGPFISQEESKQDWEEFLTGKWVELGLPD